MGADVDPSEVQLQQQAVAFLAKHLRNNCDKIFNRSIPFVIDAHILRRLCDAIGSIYTSEGESKEEDPESDLSVRFIHNNHPFVKYYYYYYEKCIIMNCYHFANSAIFSF